MAVHVIRKFRKLFDVTFGAPNDGDVVTYDAGTDKLILAPPAATVGELDDLNDVVLTAPQVGDRIEFDGADWINTASAAVGPHHASHENGGTDEIDLTDLSGVPAELAAHLADAVAAHAASAIANTPAGAVAATTVQGAIDELDTEKASAAALAAHLSDPTAAHAASAVAVTPAGGIAADDVQEALEELDSEASATAMLLGDHSARHEAGGDDEISLDGLAGIPTALQAHLDDTGDAHDASAISFTPNGSIAATDVQAAIQEVRDEAGGGAPTDVDYLVGTASGGLSAEIVVGTTPGGELGGTWDAPTVDATHSGSSHADVQAAAEATAAAALSAHLTDPTDAHGASAISIADVAGDFTATEVEGALAELQADHEADAQALADHIADASDAHDASAISIADVAGDFTATEVEGALAELQADAEADAQALADHIADATAAHAASAISVDSTNLDGTGTDLQTVLEELEDQIDAGGGGGGAGDTLALYIFTR